MSAQTRERRQFPPGWAGGPWPGQTSGPDGLVLQRLSPSNQYPQTFELHRLHGPLPVWIRGDGIATLTGDAVSAAHEAEKLRQEGRA